VLRHDAGFLSLGIALVEYHLREERHVHIILSRILRLILVHIFSFPQSPFFVVVPSHVGAPFYFCAYSISILLLIQLETPNGDAL
jgi:hypothetical protein